MNSRFLPFWLTTTTHDESVVLIGDEDRAEGRLLFTPQSIASVTSAAGDETYVEGRDFYVDGATRAIVRLPGSRTRYVTRDTIVATAGELTHPHTVSVTYTHALPDGVWQPAVAPGTLPRVSALLQHRAPLTVCVTGDSISEGYDASGFHGLEPFRAAYAPLVAQALERTYGVRVNLRNCATAGWTAADGLADTARISAANPDLVIVAFGMNDASYADADEFLANIRQLIDRVRSTEPRAEFLLVAPMLPTPECTWVVPRRFEEYRSSLMSLCGEGIRVADVTSMWRTLLEHKDAYALSGNGLNHPNDFGHTVYADVICSCLVHDVH